MPDEHESAAAAWLNASETQREIEILCERFPNWDTYQVTTFALLIEILAALDVYQLPDIDPPDPPDEPWRNAA